MPYAIPEDVVHATVVAGGLCTPYLATGRGPSVVLLSKEPSWLAGLFAGVPRHYHLVAPVPPAAVEGISGNIVASHDSIRADFPGWIDGFLDALGVARAWIVADARYADVSLAYSVAAPDRVRAVVVLQEDGLEAGGDPAEITRSLIGIVASLKVTNEFPAKD